MKSSGCGRSGLCPLHSGNGGECKVQAAAAEPARGGRVASRTPKRYRTKEVAGAVTNSVTAEDPPGASFAGWQETYESGSPGSNSRCTSLRPRMIGLMVCRK